MHKIYSYRAHAESVISWMYTIGNQIIYSALSVWSRAKKNKTQKTNKKENHDGYCGGRYNWWNSFPLKVKDTLEKHLGCSKYEKNNVINLYFYNALFVQTGYSFVFVFVF